MENKPSDIIDMIDTTFDIRSYMIDAQNRRFQAEIQWLSDNYNNSEALRAYFLNMYDVGNMALKYQYFNLLKSYSSDRLHEMATFRANLLSEQCRANEMRKVDHFSLKPISDILKFMGK